MMSAVRTISLGNSQIDCLLPEKGSDVVVIGSAPDCKPAVAGLIESCISPGPVGCHQGWHCAIGCPLRGGIGDKIIKGCVPTKEKKKRCKNYPSVSL